MDGKESLPENEFSFWNDQPMLDDIQTVMGIVVKSKRGSATHEIRNAGDIRNCFDKRCADPSDRVTNRLINEGKAGGLPENTTITRSHI